MPSQPTLSLQPMAADDKPFFKALGSRLATLRTEHKLSQQAVADELGIPQQTYAHYEVGRARMPASLLPPLAEIFGVTVDELVGRLNGRGKRGPTPKLQQQIERLNRLPKAQQQVVMKMLEGVLAQASR